MCYCYRITLAVTELAQATYFGQIATAPKSLLLSSVPRTTPQRHAKSEFSHALQRSESIA